MVPMYKPRGFRTSGHGPYVHDVALLVPVLNAGSKPCSLMFVRLTLSVFSDDRFPSDN